jgi:hypothetical protein
MAELAPVAFVLVFVAVIGLPIWLLVGALRRNRAMRDPAIGEALGQLAAAKGWRYAPRDAELVKRFDTYPFGRSGRGRPALDLITGTHRGRQFACFQYAPRRMRPPAENPVEITYIRVFVVTLPTAVPSMVITGAGSTPRQFRRYTVGDGSFDRAFMVGTDDAEFADRTLAEPLRRWLLDNPPPVRVQLLGTNLIGWRADMVGFNPHMVEPELNYLNDLVDRIPVSEQR